MAKWEFSLQQRASQCTNRHLQSDDKYGKGELAMLIHYFLYHENPGALMKLSDGRFKTNIKKFLYTNCGTCHGS